MVPEAPPRFSTTTGWPSIGAILSANSRATASTPPPGGKLTTRRMGREGKLSWAGAGEAASGAASTASESASVRFMIVPGGGCPILRALGRLPEWQFGRPERGPRAGYFTAITFSEPCAPI